jgi:hypothetical protein
MPRYVYSAHGMAVGGHIAKPVDYYIDPIASSVLPTTGGKASTKAEKYSLTLGDEFILSFDSAETRLQAGEDECEVHTTEIVATLNNLNVRNVLKADEIVSKLTLRYDAQGMRLSITTEGSYYKNLTVQGENFEVWLDHEMGRQAADFRKFQKDHPNMEDRKGRLLYSLGRGPKLKFEKYNYGFHYIENFGRIYFGEWTAALYAQHFTMLRFELGCPVIGGLELTGGGGNGLPPETGP